MASIAGKTPRDHAAVLDRDFALQWRDGTWFYSGPLSDDTARLSDPELALAVLDQLKAEMRFDHVCVVTRPVSTLLVCNTSPPLGIHTGLGEVAAARLLASIIRRGGEVHEFMGSWLTTF